MIFRKNPDYQDEADELIRAWTEEFTPMRARALKGWNDTSGNPFYEEFSAITHQDDADLHDHKDADLHEHCLMLPILNVCTKLALFYFYRVDTAWKSLFWERKAPHWEQIRNEQSEATNNAPNELCRLKVIVFFVIGWKPAEGEQAYSQDKHAPSQWHEVRGSWLVARGSWPAARGC